MSKLYLAIACGFFLLGSVTQAASRASMMSHGGLGFVFPDHNSFQNPSMFAEDMGGAVQGLYDTASMSSVKVQQMEASFVWGNGKLGLGAAVDRSQITFNGSDNKSDSMQAGLGIALVKDRLDFGVYGTKSIDTNQINGGVVGGQISLHGAKKMGPAIAFGANTTLNQIGGDKKTGTVGVGWAFNQVTAMEVNAVFNDISNTNDLNINGYINLTGQSMYASAGVLYAKLSQTQTLAGRLGFILGGRFDLSGVVFYPTASGSTPTFGGTARIAF